MRRALRWVALCLTVVCVNAAAESTEDVALPASDVVAPVADVAALEAAAQRGEVPALMALARMYERGENVEKDFTRSNALYCRAAARGNADAVLRLALIYSVGREMMPNQGVGALLVHKAAELGSERARELIPLVSRGVGSALPACMTEPAADTVVSALPSNVPKHIVQLVEHWAPQYSIDPNLVIALIGVESKFDATAVSPKNAQGLMQLIPATAARFGVKNAFNARDNLKGGLAYLRWLMAYFKGDVKLVLAAYNAGEETIERYRGIPPYRETRDYVKQITRVYTKPSHPYVAEVVTPSSVLDRIKR